MFDYGLEYCPFDVGPQLAINMFSGGENIRGELCVAISPPRLDDEDESLIGSCYHIFMLKSRRNSRNDLVYLISVCRTDNPYTVPIMHYGEGDVFVFMKK